MDFEKRQITEKQCTTQRYVESLVTGEFQRVMRKDFDPNAVSDMAKFDTSGDGIVSTTEISDFEMREQQRIWVNRLANIFGFIFGLLGGIGLLDLFILLSIPGREQYLASFRGFINLSCGLQ